MNLVFGEGQSRLYPHMRAKFGHGPTFVSKKGSFKFISRCEDSIEYNGGNGYSYRYGRLEMQATSDWSLLLLLLYVQGSVLCCIITHWRSGGVRLAPLAGVRC